MIIQKKLTDLEYLGNYFSFTVINLWKTKGFSSFFILQFIKESSFSIKVNVTPLSSYFSNP